MRVIKAVALTSCYVLLSACANVPERAFSSQYDANAEMVSQNLRNAMQNCWSRAPVPLKDGFKFDERQENGKRVFEAYGYASDGRSQPHALVSVEPENSKTKVQFMQPELRGAFTEKRGDDDESRWQDMKRWSKGDYNCK